MAAPMSSGAPAGGARPATVHNNFEYDDNEWDIGIGDLIIDLDADIEKTDGGGGMAARPEPDAQRTALKMKIKRTKPGTKSSEAKHEIVKSAEVNGEAKPAPQTPSAVAPASPQAAKRPGSHRRDKAREKHPHGAPPPHDVNGATRAAPNTPGPPASGVTKPETPALAAKAMSTAPVKLPVVAKPPAVPAKTEPAPPITASAPAVPAPMSMPAKQEPPAPAVTKAEAEEQRRETSPAPPPAKKAKTEHKETAEVCVGTSVGTITEPDCLGPCEPGTSVTLEGIVWHETEGGVLVVNVTWRGKTYVGTLLDCTRHDWAPPRFCDSPTEELDARTPKGRGAKRGRGAAPDLTNFTETRSGMHSKLRNGGGKGRRALPSPTPFTPPRADPAKRRPPPTRQEDEQKPKRPPPSSSPPPDPVLLECPEPNCSKKYKHANGLKYHRSHAHGADDEGGSASEAEEPGTAPASPAPPPPPVTPATPAAEPTPTPSPAPPSPALKPQALRFDEPPPVAPVSPVAPPPPPEPCTPPPQPRDAPSPHFKVKPTSSLMPADGSPEESPTARRRRSPRPPAVRSPAYSDISDDAAPDTESVEDKPEQPFPLQYQYYPQPPYLVPDKPKDDPKSQTEGKREKEVAKIPTEQPPTQKMMPQHFYPYGYMPPGFPFNVEAPYAHPPPNTDDKTKDGGDKAPPSPAPPAPLPKPKPAEPPKEPSKHPNDNHQILKESIEMKSQMSPFVYQQRAPPSRDDEMRRYYMMRKEAQLAGAPPEPSKSGGSPHAAPSRAPLPQPLAALKPPPKDPVKEEPKILVKEEPKGKQEGQKPTMETTGPPPPPTSQYYLPPYMQNSPFRFQGPPHYAGLPFDPMYRGGINPMLVSAPFAPGWGGMPRYHAPEDLSRPPPPKHEMLPSYYPQHKIHELSDHAKSPPGKPPPSEAPSGAKPPSAPPAAKPLPADGKESSRSPPPQRHVHTHHHTHVGLGYPLYPAPYGAAVLASQQAVVNSFPTTK